jgi:hypothetical protein
MTADEPQAVTPQPELRWYQYRLRSLVVLMFLVAVVMAVITTLGLGLLVGFTGLVLSVGYVLLLALALTPIDRALSRFPYRTSLALTPILYVGLAFAFFIFGEAIDQPHPACVSGNWLTHGVADFVGFGVLTTAGMLIVVALDAAVQTCRPRDRSYYPRLQNIWRGRRALPVRLIFIIGGLLIVGYYADSVVAVWRESQDAGGWVWPPKRVFVVCQIMWGLLWLADCTLRPNRGTIAAAVGYLCMALLFLAPAGEVLRE